jgi:opacity protein-like surface antigen
MRSKRMLLGATVASCLAAAMLSGVHAQQETDKNNQLNVNGSAQAQQHGGMNNRSNSGAAGDQSATGQSGGANQTARTNKTARFEPDRPHEPDRWHKPESGPRSQ